MGSGSCASPDRPGNRRTLDPPWEEGLNGVGAQIDLLRADIAQLREDMSQLREDMNAQNRQLREDMNLQFTYQFQLTLGLLGAFTVLVAATISLPSGTDGRCYGP